MSAVYSVLRNNDNIAHLCVGNVTSESTKILIGCKGYNIYHIKHANIADAKLISISCHVYHTHHHHLHLPKSIHT